jgi:hypothetical protein
MLCPKCQYIQTDHNEICDQCGIVFAKYQARQQDPGYTKAVKQRHRKQFELHHIEPKGWTYLGIGIGLGLLLFYLDLWMVNATIGALITLIHEMGHAAMGWFFGHPSIPSFDFRHGGGITHIRDQNNGLVYATYALFAYGLFYYRHNGLTLVILIGLIIFHASLAFSEFNEMLILFMGHGAELIIATVFIYRGLSNTAIVHQIERPLYATLGFYIVFHDIGFAWKLIYNSGYRVEYEAQKGGYHFGDFSRIAEWHMGTDLSVVAGFFLLCCLLVPVLGFLLWRYQEPWTNWLYDRIDPQP